MQEIEDNIDDTQEEVLPFKYSITSYGADYPIDGLVKRINNEDIYVPDFQRGYVWKIREASRFIESLLLGLPVPGIFLSKESDTQKLLVIDGQQRLRTIQYFYNGVFEPTQKAFSLEGISPEHEGLSAQYEGVTYKTLREEDRRRLDDSIMPATIVKQDKPSEDESSIYHIFERLNTGGDKLQPQEIRACIYHGEFNKLLGELNKLDAWRKIYGKVDPRMRDQELILRFLALYFNGEEYKNPLKGFLNNFMAKNRALSLHSKDSIIKIFSETAEIAYDCFGEKAFKPRQRLNAAVFDAVMVGLAYRLKRGLINDKESVRSSYGSLLENKKFLSSTIDTARTTDSIEVGKRLKESIKVFASIQ
jgi:Protein of unknown function DUF262